MSALFQASTPGPLHVLLPLPSMLFPLGSTSPYFLQISTQKSHSQQGFLLPPDLKFPLPQLLSPKLHILPSDVFLPRIATTDFINVVIVCLPYLKGSSKRTGFFLCFICCCITRSQMAPWHTVGAQQTFVA